jgi:hypothetical protein
MVYKRFGCFCHPAGAHILHYYIPLLPLLPLLPNYRPAPGAGTNTLMISNIPNNISLHMGKNQMTFVFSVQIRTAPGGAAFW